MSDQNLLSTIEALAERLRLQAKGGTTTTTSAGENVDLASILQELILEARSSEPKQAKDIVPETYTKPFMDFINNNPTEFHAADHFATKLEDAGFVKLSERKSWDGLKAGGKYFVVRNGSNLVAFVIPMAYKVGNGIAMIAAHIDAVTAKLKPVSKKPNVEGYVQLGVAPYGGSTFGQTWWDRDLAIGGRVIVKNAEGKFESKLVKLDWPVARISSLAVHFGAVANGPFNAETQMVPVIGQESAEDDEHSVPAGSFAATQPVRLVKAVCSELGITDISSLVSWELQLYQYQPAALGGLSKEFLFAPRIDDKLCSWSAIEALIEASKNVNSGGTINLCALYDDEEVGSNSRQGAKSNLMSSSIERILEAFHKDGKPGPNLVGQTYANSFLLSADVIHAVNNNFTDVYLPGHMPRLNTGLTVSCDPNGHMTTDSVSYALLHRIAEKGGHKLQVFQIRNDSRSGGTVGPMLSAAMGVRAIDAGMPQLSMHSIRAATGANDPGLGVQIFLAFYQYYEETDAEIKFTE